MTSTPPASATTPAVGAAPTDTPPNTSTATPTGALTPTGTPSGTVSLVPGLPSIQPVGVTVTWAASATAMGAPVYRFSVATPGGPYSVVRDYSPTNAFMWTPLQEGSYDVEVAAKDGFGSPDTTAIVTTVPFSVTSRVTGTAAVINPTANPLVALYSAPPCSTGQIVVLVRPTSDLSWTSTPPQTCQPGMSSNFLVAGLHANTTYLLEHVVTSDAGSITSDAQSFTTGAPPSTLTFPSFTVPQAPDAQAGLDASVIFHVLGPNPAGVANPLATDLDGNLVWYYDTLQSGLSSIWPTELVPGGSVLLLGRDSYRTSGFDVVREVDWADRPWAQLPKAETGRA